MNILKITFLSADFFFLVSCHNNAHLRTQKLLEKDESVISLSGVLPMGEFLNPTGIVMRLELLP